MTRCSCKSGCNPVSLWSRIADALALLGLGEGLSAVFDKLRTPPERTAAFAIAMIALGAKIAKADGLVTRDEVTAFRQVFQIPQGEEANAARVYNLARQDIAGYQDYAHKIKAMYADQTAPLSDLIEGLLHIATADGTYHPDEDVVLIQIARIFGLTPQLFSQLRAAFVPDAERDPYDVLGVAADTALDDIRIIWRGLVRDTHPDRLAARGVPPEAVRLAELRLIAVNAAWDAVQADRA